jgi:hypothetical protein
LEEWLRYSRDCPASAGLFFARLIDKSQFPRFLPNLIFISAKEASGFRYRPAVDDFVRQVTDVHLGPEFASMVAS